MSGRDEDLDRLLHQFIDTHPDSVWMFSPDWSELKFGERTYEELWGRPLDELHADPTVFLEGVHPDDRDHVENAMERLSNEESVEVEFRILPADEDTPRDVWVEGRPVYDETGAFVAIAGYVRDISDQKQRERQLEYTNARMEAFNQFLSHDLANQLQMATGYLQLAREDVDSPHLEQVSRALARMEEMTSDVLALPRLDFDSIERENISLTEFAENCWTNTDLDGATLHVTESGTVHADPSLFKHVFENLFRNAVAHNGDPVAVTVGFLPDRSGIYVKDDGQGIPPKERAQIFDLGTSTSGSGIGLALVQEIVDVHGGSITVTESDAGGARFEIESVDQNA